MIDLELIINIAIIALLIPTILYLIKLNKNLTILRNNQRSLTQLTQLLNEAAAKAENAVPKLKEATTKSAQELMNVVNFAKSTKKELEYSNGRAEFLAKKLEEAISTTKYPQSIAPSLQKTIEATPKTYPSLSSNFDNPKKDIDVDDNLQDYRSEAEAELIKALNSIK